MNNVEEQGKSMSKGLKVKKISGGYRPVRGEMNKIV